MAYLQKADITIRCHGNLRLHNFLLSVSGAHNLETKTGPIEFSVSEPVFIAKISDFGHAPLSDFVTTNIPLNRDWFAPEVLGKNLHSFESDVWTFGLAIWHLLVLLKTKENVTTPYTLSPQSPLFDALKAGLRPKFAFEGVDTLKSLIASCLEFDPQKRPSFQEIASILKKCINSKEEKYGESTVTWEELRKYIRPPSHCDKVEVEQFYALLKRKLPWYRGSSKQNLGKEEVIFSNRQS